MSTRGVVELTAHGEIVLHAATEADRVYLEAQLAMLCYGVWRRNAALVRSLVRRHNNGDVWAEEVQNPLNLALAPMQLTEGEAREMDELLTHPRAYPTVPILGIPRGDRSRILRPSSK